MRACAYPHHTPRACPRRFPPSVVAPHPRAILPLCKRAHTLALCSHAWLTHVAGVLLTVARLQTAAMRAAERKHSTVSQGSTGSDGGATAGAPRKRVTAPSTPSTASHAPNQSAAVAAAAAAASATQTTAASAAAEAKPSAVSGGSPVKKAKMDSSDTTATRCDDALRNEWHAFHLCCQRAAQRMPHTLPFGNVLWSSTTTVQMWGMPHTLPFGNVLWSSTTNVQIWGVSMLVHVFFLHVVASCVRAC